MKKYLVSIPWHAVVFVHVEANSIEEAKEKGLEEAYPGLCHQCTDTVEMGEFADQYEDQIEATEIKEK